MEAEHRRLMAEWNKQSKDLGAIGTALKQLKDLMNNADALRGDVYEIEVLCAILNSDLEAFHEAISVLISFYQSYSLNKEWPNKWLMIGLNLMYLLATKQHAQFHMFLEQIDQDVQQNNPYIWTPVKLEQSLMEGAYNKVIS
ncbi:unnamed protein product [Gongylonema pulchrum]|uniref:CSN8_PSD8_EIF3K domain-containing protein n=1 Tax=Gongylonema pulchrum TaxID=637853 RepID=A0A183E5W1_9BILA|nr:unnamed protein product [Gongylonema pulchrum]